MHPNRCRIVEGKKPPFPKPVRLRTPKSQGQRLAHGQRDVALFAKAASMPYTNLW